MPRVLLLGLIAVVAVCGCRKKSSPEYYDAQSSYSILVSRLGDDAYADAEMETIKSRLEAVPADSQEAGDAVKLLATIAAEEKRVAAEQSAPALAQAATRPPSLDEFKFPAGGTDTSAAAAAPADAGPGEPVRPWRGMTEDEFGKTFGDCASPSGPAELPGKKEPGTGWAVKADEACEGRLGVRPGATFVFDDHKLVGSVTVTTVGRPGAEEGPPPRAAPPAPPAPAAPYIPGFPPPGADKKPPPPPERALPAANAPALPATPPDFQPPPAESALPPAQR